MEDRVLELEKVRYVEIQDERDERVLSLESAAAAFDDWCPRIEGSLFFVRSEVDRLSKLWDRSIVAQAEGSTTPQGTSELVTGQVSAGAPTDWPTGHGVDLTPRDTGYGSVSTMTPYPANGTFPAPKPPPPPPPLSSYPPHPPPLLYPPPPIHHPPPPLPYPPPPPHSPYFMPPPYPSPTYPPASAPPPFHPVHLYPTFFPTQPHSVPPPSYHNNQANPNLGHLPKMLFPQFDGDNPKLWLSRACSHFEMYSVHPAIWVRVATHYFTHAAARWLLLSLKCRTFPGKPSQLLYMSGSAVISMNCCYASFFHITHTSTVSEYIEKFTDLYEQLKAYNPNPDKLYFTTRFIDGLREEIRSVILVARP